MTLKFINRASGMFAVLFFLFHLVPVAEASGSNEGVIALTKILPSGNRLVLVGVNGQDLTAEKTANLIHLGFESQGQDISKLDPKYLIELTGKTPGKGDLKRVYSFELGVDKSGLPKVLIDYDNVIAGLTKKQVAKITAFEAVQIAEPLTKSAGRPISNMFTHHDLHEDSAWYLEYIVDRALPFNDSLAPAEITIPTYFTSLRNSIGDNALMQLGSSVYLKFNNLGMIVSALTTESDLQKAYANFRARRRDFSLQQMGSIDAHANRNEGLNIYMIGNDFELMTLDCQQSLSIARQEHRFFSNKLDIKTASAEKLRSDLLEICKSGGEIPLGFFSESNGKDFYQIADFSDPNKLRNQALQIATSHIATDIAIAVVAPASFFVRIGRVMVSHFVKRTGSKVFTSPRTRIYPEYRAAVETGVLNPNSLPLQLGDNTTTFKAALLKILDENNGISAEAKTRVQSLLASTEPQDLQKAFLEISKLSSENQRGTRLFSGRNQVSQESLRQTVSLTSLSNYFNDWAKVSQLDQSIKSRIVEHQDVLTQQNERRAEKAERQQAKARQAGDSSATTQPVVPNSGNDLCSSGGPSLILFKVDGLMMDQLNVAAAKNWIPTIKARFLDNGVEFKNVFTRNSVSTASWIEAESGFRSSDTGVIGSATTTRDAHDKVDSYLNPMHEFDGKRAGIFGDERGTRTYQVLQKAGIKLIDDYVGARSYDAWNVLVHNGKNLPYKGVKSDLMKNGLHLFFTEFLMMNTLDYVSVFDAGAGAEVAEEMASKPCQYKVIQIWLGGADHIAHGYPNGGRETFQHIDQAVNAVLTTASNDPILKKAKIMMVSDHGLDGGFIRAGGSYDFLGMAQAYHLNNTEFNVNKYFSGQDVKSYGKYFETVISHNVRPEATQGDALVNILKGASKGSVQAGIENMLGVNASYIEKGRLSRLAPKVGGGQDYHRQATMAVETYGDSQAQVYMFAHPENPARRSTYFELSNFQPSAEYKAPRNIIDDLLSVSVRNLDRSEQGAAKDALVQEKIRAKFAARPVGLIAMALQNDVKLQSFISSIMNQAGLSGNITRDPILIKKLDAQTNTAKTALVLVQDTVNPDGSSYTIPQLAYVVVRDFSQNPSGDYTGVAVSSGDNASDPLNYVNLTGSGSMSRFLTEEELLPLTLSSKGNETTLPFLVGLLDPSPSLLQTSFGKTAQAQVPDMVLWANPGFNFNTSQNHDADHGSPLSSRISWLVGDCKHGEASNNAIETPAYSTAIAPTVLEFLGAPVPAGMASRSLKPEIEARCN